MLVSLDVGGVLGFWDFLRSVIVLCFGFGVLSLSRLVPMCRQEMYSLLEGIGVFQKSDSEIYSKCVFSMGAIVGAIIACC